MKFDIKVPSLDGVARVEITTTREQEDWAAYIAFVYPGPARDACLLLGQSGVPHRFTGENKDTAEAAAKKFLQDHYEVVKMIW